VGKTGMSHRHAAETVTLSIVVFSLTVMLLCATGCQNLVQRAQSPDSFSLPLRDNKEKDKPENNTKYIGDACGIFGLNYAKVEGIGVAVNLKGTGSNPKPGGQRDHLAREIKAKSNDIDIEKMLASTNTEMVLMKGLLPPGIRAGEKFDIEIGTLPGTEATSLEGGMVMQTNMRPMEQLGKAVKQGHIEALGKGSILIDGLFESRNDKPNQMHGYILGGGTALKDRELGLNIRGEQFDIKTTTMIARAINARFTHADNTGRHGVAEPKTDRYIVLVIPDSHRHNIGRYLQVIINIAHSESASQRLMRMEQLTEDIFVPHKSAVTALRLEALGNDGIPILNRALKSENLEVKFQAAQALAYMGEINGIEHLRFVAETEPAFRWHALTALASLKQSEAGTALAELLHVPSAETRYGAFDALRTRSASDPLVAGQWIGDFFLHRVPSPTKEPMLHFSRRQRPEIVVFGDHQTVGHDFLYVESGLTVKAIDDGKVSITRYSSTGKEERKVCSNRVADLTVTLAKSGMGYGDLLKMFRFAKNNQTLNSRLAVNATPRLGRTYVPGNNAEPPPNSGSDSEIDLAGAPAPDDESTTKLSSPLKNLKTPMTDDEANTFTKMKDWFGGKK